MNTLSNSDHRFIAGITGNRARCNTWNKIATYGVRDIYGGLGAPTSELTTEEEAMWFEERTKQYHDPRWKRRRDRKVFSIGYCECCGSARQLEVHHIQYYRDRHIWEYSDDELKVLCKKCHLQQHGMKIRANGTIDRL
jgi:hypothetical protein